jgi:hypothetical protein
MTLLDPAAPFATLSITRLRPWISLVAGIALSAALLVAGAILFRGFSENGFRLGSQLAWRFTTLVFFAALVAGPIARLAARVSVHGPAPRHLSRKLVWGFCASYAVYLVSVFLPNVIHLSAGATLMVLFGGVVTAVLALSAAPLGLMNEKIRRTVMGTAAVYFWSCYSLMALSRLYGPHRPDAFYGISLCLMVAALLVRYADRWLSRFSPATI